MRWQDLRPVNTLVVLAQYVFSLLMFVDACTHAASSFVVFNIDPDLGLINSIGASSYR